MRVVVQRTFIEVVEEDNSVPMEMTLRRSFSTPVTSSRRDNSSPGKQKEEAERFGDRLDVIQQGQQAKDQADREPKTTVAFRNIPLHFTRDQLMQHLDARGFAGWYDFLYLPIDFAKCKNFGYAFINLSSAERAERILAEFDGLSWGDPGEGQAVVGWSLTQGLELHIERYRNSPVMHESMLDECKPIVLEDGVRVDFPPPTRKVQRLRRLRTRCGSRGRGVSSSGLCGNLGMEANHAGDAPGSCTLLPGLSSAPGGTSQEKHAILASPLLAGLTEAPGECPTASTGRLQKKASWADLQDDHDEGASECSTQSPGGYFSGTPSSDGSGWASDDLAAVRRGSGSSAQPWSGSMLAQGLMPSLPEEMGAQPPVGLPRPGSLIEVVDTYPSGAHAIVTAVDHEEGTYNVQLMHNGCRTRRLRTIRCKHARLLRHAEGRQ